MKSFAILISMIFCTTLVFSQNERLTDSILKKINTQREIRRIERNGEYSLIDSIEAKDLFALSKAYFGNDPQKAIDKASHLLTLSENIGYSQGIANAHYCLGSVALDKGQYPLALQHLKTSLDLNIKLKNKISIAACYNSFGIIYWSQGNYSKALENYLGALKTMEELGNKNGMAVLYGNIGIINVEQGELLLAEKNYKTSLKIFAELNDQQGISTAYNNLGNVFADEGKHQLALEYYSKAIEIQKEMNDDDGISISNNNIGEIYLNLGQYDEALIFLFNASKIQYLIEDKEGLSGTLLNIGTAYLKKKDFISARKYLNQSLEFSKEIESLDNLQNNYEVLAQLDSAEGNFAAAFLHYKLFVLARDSLFSEANTRKLMAAQMQYDFDKKESLNRAEQEKKDALAKKELQKQKLIRDGFMIVFGVVTLFAFVFFKQRNNIRIEKKRSDDLLLNILPVEVADELKSKGSAEAKQYESVTVMFTDFKNFTQISEQLSPAELVAEIDSCFNAFDEIITQYNIEKIKTIGDSYMCVGGLPIPNSTHPIDVISAALEIQDFMVAHQKANKSLGKPIFEIRIGIHSGPVVAGIVGSKKFAYDIWGDTVNIASRMESSGEAGKVNISGSTFELVKDRFQCEYRGKVEAKNKGEIDMYFVNRLASA